MKLRGLILAFVLAYTPATARDAREFLSKDRDYFVRSDAAENCDGRANVAQKKWWWSSCAFKHWNEAIEVVTALDFGNHDVRVINGDGATYNEGIEIKSPWVGGGRLIFDLGGGGLAPEKYIAFSVRVAIPTLIIIQNGTISSGGTGIAHSGSGLLRFGEGLTIGKAAGYQAIASAPGARISAVGMPFNVAGGGRSGLVAADGGQFNANHAKITCLGDVTYAGEAFAYAERPGSILTLGRTKFEGCENMKGRKYFGLGLALIDVLEGGEDFLPGDRPGDLQTGAQYR